MSIIIDVNRTQTAERQEVTILEITYSKTKTINGYEIYEPCLNWEHHYTIRIKDTWDCVNVHEVDGKLEIISAYAKHRNYFANRYLKQYRSNADIQAVLRELEKDF